MLVVSNGAFKSGSTWLFNILRCITQFPPPPDRYCNSEWVNPSIHPDRLGELLQTQDLATKNYLVKNHFGSKQKRSALLSCEDVRVFNITRDLRDVVVSAYYHYRNKNGYAKPFGQYYWARGRFVARKVKRYHALWDISSPQVYVSSFSDLKERFEEECVTIGQVLGLNLAPEQVAEIKKATSITSLRGRYDDKNFFRKGTMGDYKNHMNGRMERDLARIENGHFEHMTYWQRKYDQVYSSFFSAVRMAIHKLGI